MPIADPHAVVADLYRLLSPPIGMPIDRKALSDLFLPDARIRGAMADNAGVEDVLNFSVTDYLDVLDRMVQAPHADGLAGMKRELWERTECYSHIAQAFSTFESAMTVGGQVHAGRGVNAIQLLHTSGAWRIAAWEIHVERQREPIPGRYLGGEPKLTGAAA